YREDINYFKYFETDFPAIVFDDPLGTDQKISFKPTVSPLDDNNFNFKISFDEFDDEDYTVLYDKKLFSYKLISVNNLKTDSENDNIKVNVSLGDIVVEQSENGIDANINTQSHEFDKNFEPNHGIHNMATLPPRDQRYLWLRYEGQEYTNAIIYDYEDRISDTVLDLYTADTLCFQLGGLRRQMSLSLREIASKADLHDYWYMIVSDGDFLGPVPSYTSIRDPLRRLCHRLIAFNISRRGQAPEKAWVASGLERQQVVAAKAAQEIPKEDVQRMARLEEAVRRVRESLGEQRAVLDMMSQDFSRFVTWTIGCLSQLLDAGGVTYTRYADFQILYQRHTRRRTSEANTLAAPCTDYQPDT
ncbi:hypothetical protein Tco_0245938, partial [Tanacetum coccineum]